MSVLIKGMKMPDSCYHCKIAESCGHYIANYTNRRHPDCPLIALPDTHGRIVDADELIIDLMDRGLEGIQTDDWVEIQHTVMEQPTIVEAEGENADHN